MLEVSRAFPPSPHRYRNRFAHYRWVWSFGVRGSPALHRRKCQPRACCKKRRKVKPNAIFMTLYPLRTTPPLRDSFILFFEGLGSLRKCLARPKLAEPVLGAKLKIPIFCNVLGAGKAVFLRTSSPLFAFEICGAMPRAAVPTAVKAYFVAHRSVYFYIASNLCEFV